MAKEDTPVAGVVVVAPLEETAAEAEVETEETEAEEAAEETLDVVVAGVEVEGVGLDVVVGEAGAEVLGEVVVEEEEMGTGMVMTTLAARRQAQME